MSIFEEKPRCTTRSIDWAGNLHRHGDDSLKSIEQADRFRIAFVGVGVGVGIFPFIDNGDDDATFPVPTVELGLLCCSVLDETAPVANALE